MMHSRWINGNLAYWDTFQNRIIDAFGATVCKFADDFVALHLAADAPYGWSTTLVEAGIGESTVATTDGAGGLLLITSDANENDGAQMQVTNEAFKLLANKPCYFGIKWKGSDATQSDYLVGLCITDTTLLASAPSDGVYFRKDDGDASLDFVTNKNSTLTTATAAATLVDDTYVTTEFYWDGSATVYAYIDGVQVAAHTTNIVDDEEITPSIAFLSGAAGVKTMTVDWVRAIQFN